MISCFLTNYSLNKVLEIHYIAQCHKTFYLQLKYIFSLTSFPLPREYDAARLNAFKASEAHASLTFQGLSCIEIWASGSPFHFQLADKIFHDNKDRCRLPLRRSSIKASVMRSDESWEISNAPKRCFFRQGYGETLECHRQFPCANIRGHWLNFPINTPPHLTLWKKNGYTESLSRTPAPSLTCC